MPMVGCPLVRMTGIGGTGGRAVMNSNRPYRSSFFLGLLLLAAHLTAFTARAADPKLFIMGVWPDRLRLWPDGQPIPSLQRTGRPVMRP